MKNARQYLTLIGAALVGVAVIAKTFGPFFVSAIGPDYATTTYNGDMEAEYDAANKIAQIYLAPLLNTPSAISAAIRNGVLRVVYYDGKIADFRIRRWPSAQPLEFSELVASATTRARSRVLDDATGREGCRGSGYVTMNIPTGFWGTDFDVVENPDATVITPFTVWVDTGTVSLRVPTGVYFCP